MLKCRPIYLGFFLGFICGIALTFALILIPAVNADRAARVHPVSASDAR